MQIDNLETMLILHRESVRLIYKLIRVHKKRCSIAVAVVNEFVKNGCGRTKKTAAAMREYGNLSAKAKDIHLNLLLKGIETEKTWNPLNVMP